MPVDPHAAKAIFMSALDKDDRADQAAYVAQACGDDDALRQRVEILLKAHSDPGSFLVPLAETGATIDQRPSEIAGAVVGPYKLIEPIGEGGMGSVWMAQQQEPVKRLVALKLIKAGMDTKQIIARFEAERQALALMDHPNIAKVLDAGTTARNAHFEDRKQKQIQSAKPNLQSEGIADISHIRASDLGLVTEGNVPAADFSSGRPYFVMELVKGMPITKYCDAHRLTTRQRLELFIPVCQAVQHAHQKGIIHRDLKPSNVLVALYDAGAPGVPKVIDFGVAKAAGRPLTEQTLVTGFCAIVGTLEYMSPEQAELNQLDIDTRSDIYSLGVLLYELLTGSPPFTRKELEKAGMLEMLRVIREQEPSKPSTKLSMSETLPALAANRGTEPTKLTKLMQGELDWIVMKALEKDRNRRYDSANSFAMDVQRYLADEPVLACPPSVGYRLHKFARRNKGPVLAAALLLLSLVVGSIGTTWGMLRANRAKAEAVDEANQKAQALKDRESALQKAEGSEREKTLQLALSYFKEAQAKRFGGRAGRRFESLELLNEAAAIYRSLDELSEERKLTLRNEAIAALALVDLQAGEPWELPAGWSGHGPFFDPTLQYYAVSEGVSSADQARFHARQGQVSIRRLADHQEIARLPSSGAVPYKLFFSPNGQFLAVTYHRDQPLLVSVWDWNREKAILHLPAALVTGHGAFSPMSESIALHYRDGTVRVHELPSGKEMKCLAGFQAEPPGGCHPSFQPPDGRRIAVSVPGGVRILDLDTKEVVTLPHTATVNSIAWRGDGRLLATGCANDAGQQFNAHVWDLADPSRPRHAQVLKGHQGDVVGVAFNHAGTLLATGGWDSETRLWDPATGRQLLRASSYSDLYTFSPDDRHLVPGTAGSKVWLWEVAKSQVFRTFHGHIGYKQPTCVDISPDGRLMVSTDDNGVRLWDLAADREWDKSAGFLPTGHCFSAFADPRGDALITAGKGAGLQRWPIALNDKRIEIGPPETLGTSPRAPFKVLHGTASLSLDGRTVAFVPSTSAGLLLDLKDPLQKVALTGYYLESLQVSPDCKWVVGAGFHNRETPVWNARTGELVKLLPIPGRSSPVFSPDGGWVTTGTTSGEARFWEVGTWRVAYAVQAKEGNVGASVRAFRRDGKMAAVHHWPRGLIQLIDPDTGREFATLEPPDPQGLSSLCFSADGGQLAVACSTGLVQVWDLRLLRHQLANLGLDWELPPYQSEPQRKQPAEGEPLRIEIINSTPLPPDKEADAQALFDRGMLSTQLNQFQFAISDFDHAQRLNPQLRPWEELIRLCSEAIERNTANAAAYHARAHANERLSRWEQAIADYSTALELAPQNLSWHVCRGKAYLNLGQVDKAVHEFRQAGELKPKDANNLAWKLVTSPQLWDREPHFAVELARRAVSQAPAVGTYWNTLGVASYRAGQWQEGIAAFEKSMELRQGGDSLDWFFLAMALWQLKNQPEAQKWFNRAVQWMEEHQPKNDELRRFRAEAEVLLEINKPGSKAGKQEPK